MRRFTTCQCVWDGWCINWESLLTEKLMSGLVNARYWSLPIALRYFFASLGGEPSFNLREIVVDNGVETPWQSYIENSCKMSIMHLVWERNNPADCGRTLMPRKKCRGPRSLSEKRLESALLMLLIVCKLFPIITISSTYESKKMTGLWECKVNKELIRMRLAKSSRNEKIRELGVPSMGFLFETIYGFV